MFKATDSRRSRRSCRSGTENEAPRRISPFQPPAGLANSSAASASLTTTVKTHVQGLKTQKRSKADGIAAAGSPGTPGEGGSCRSTQLRPTLCPQPCDIWAATGKHFSAQLVAPCWALPREPEAGETRVLPLPGFIPAAGHPPAVAAWTVAPTTEASPLSSAELASPSPCFQS